MEQSAEGYYGKEYQDITRRVPSIQRAREILHWEPKYGFDESIRKMIAHYVHTESMPGDGSSAAEVHG